MPERPQGFAAVLLAAGRSSRMGGTVDDKILAAIGRTPVFVYSLRAFAASGTVGHLVVVYRDEDQRGTLEALWRLSPAARIPVSWVQGGRERQDSVWRALQLLGGSMAGGFVLIHDCARPLVRPAMIRKLKAVVRRDGAACLAHRVSDTIKQVRGDGSPERARVKTIDREGLWAAETPQGFELDLITRAYETVRSRRWKVTDDLSAVERATRSRVSLVENPHPNPKITRRADLTWAAFVAEGRNRR